MHNPLDRLLFLLSRLPGMGPRSARRAMLHLIKQRESLLFPLAEALFEAGNAIIVCPSCGNLDTKNPCAVCSDGARDKTIICVVEEVGDLWAIERSNNFRGQYHVLGGTLSALDGRGPEELNIASLLTRAAGDEVREIILATNATVDGQTTAHYLTDRLQGLNLTISRIAQGVPIGGELDYLDDGTLNAAIKARQPF